jgi:YidC/Oxa1 family membrane protein insertase
MQSSGTSASFAYTVYMGPLDYDRLAAYGADAGKLIDLGPNMFRPFARGTLWIMKTMHAAIPNYGWVIVILSVVLKVVFYPLTKSSTQSMRRMQEIQPRLQKLRERYKDDQQRQSKEMLELYKQHKINPMGGCLPLLVQMPVFWALFTVLRASIELRQAPWVAWITDLSVPDVLFRLPFSLPIFGDKFCLLPTLMALAMWAQTKLGATPTPTGEGAMAMQMRMMNTLMPIMMFVFFYNSPAGLSLYWLINTVLTALQTWKIHREMTPVGDVAPEAKPA